MEPAELQTRLEALEAALELATSANMEVFYWWCTALMISIHAGFLAYEMGASRAKNALTSGMKNLVAFAFLIPFFYFVGWYIYLAFPGGFTISEDGAGGLPWSQYMGPNLADQESGIFWAAFTLFGATTASIMSGSVIERIRVSAFVILAIVLGSVLWILGAAWGWHPDGWLVTQWGYHDIGAAGAVHMVSGFFTLGVLINLGPRIGRFNDDGTVNEINGHSMPMSLIGLMMIVLGFFGFLGGCIIYTGGAWETIYATPATFSAFGFNTLMGISGGMIGAYLVTRDPFWMMSGALIGVISSASGLDVYYPPLAFLISFAGGCVVPKLHNILLTRFKIDDAVGAVGVHGFAGIWGILACGLFASGYPSMVGGPAISFSGQFVGMIVYLLLGFVPGYVLSLAMKSFGLLRSSREAEIAGLDLAEVPAVAYPESRVPAFGDGKLTPAE